MDNKNIYGKKKGKRILKDLIAYPPKGNPRRTSNGYPTEIIYDDFAYERIIDFYREHIREALKRL